MSDHCEWVFGIDCTPYLSVRMCNVVAPVSDPHACPDILGVCRTPATSYPEVPGVPCTSCIGFSQNLAFAGTLLHDSLFRFSIFFRFLPQDIVRRDASSLFTFAGFRFIHFFNTPVTTGTVPLLIALPAVTFKFVIFGQ